MAAKTAVWKVDEMVEKTVVWMAVRRVARKVDEMVE